MTKAVEPAGSACDPDAFLRLPKDERDRVLRAQAEELHEHYLTDTGWQEAEIGDLFEN